MITKKCRNQEGCSTNEKTPPTGVATPGIQAASSPEVPAVVDPESERFDL